MGTAARVLAAHQQVADQHQQAQQERQMHALRKQAGLNDFKNGRDGRDGSAAAGAKSKTLAMQERNVAAQQQVCVWLSQSVRSQIDIPPCSGCMARVLSVSD